MNILRKFTWKSIWKNRTRTIVTIIGIILSTAMFMAVTTLGYSLWDYMVRRDIYNTGDHYLKYHYTSEEHIHSLAQDERVSKLGTLGILGYTEVEKPDSSNSETTRFAVAAGDKAFFEMTPIRLEEGRLPENGSEIVIDRNFCIKLENNGQRCAIGDTVTLDISPVYDEESALPSNGKTYNETYTIVGISNAFVHLDDFDLYISHLFTFAQTEDAPLWYRVYVKTHNPKDALALMQQVPEGVVSSTNNTLLALYGVTNYQNYNSTIILISCVLAAIIMTGSVSLIYNAFSISVSERTKQFGILSSVGATKRQIRWSVFSEAALLSAIGIPLGIISGYAGIAVTVNILSGRIHTLLSTGNGNIYLKPVLSPLAIIAAVVVAMITILISAVIPAQRATKISAIDAIRQSNDFAVPRRRIHASKLNAKLFGLPGVLSKKYYKVSNRKYQTTVISLVISIVLFVCAANVSQMIQQTVDRTIDTEAFDMVCYGDEETLEKLREQDFVEDSVYFATDYFTAFAPDTMLSEDLLNHWDTIQAHYDSLDKNMPDVLLVYLEDNVFRQYLSDHDLPAQHYFSDEVPSALVIAKQLTIYERSEEYGTTNRYTYEYAPYNAEGEMLRLISSGSPSGLKAVGAENTHINTCDYYVNEDGQPILAIVPVIEKEGGKYSEDWENRVEYVIRWETGTDGITTASYHFRSTATGEIANTPELVEEVTAPQIKIGATVRDLPFGISTNALNSYAHQYLILPMSAAPDDLHSGPELCITVSDYPAARNYLDINIGELNYRDYKESEETNRTLILLINVFSYGFIILISLICIGNVFNTISTNVALRRRDFGMLRSTGFRRKDLLHMMYYECLTYGCKALLWGLPTSLVLCYFIQHIDRSITISSFLPPWRAVFTATACVFLVVFITMFYTMSKLRNDNLIDAIRMENI